MFHVKPRTIKESESSMSDTTNTDAPVLPWVRSFGAWVFAYTGGTTVRIRPEGTDVSGWTNLINLNDYHLTPATVTASWLRDRAREWVADHNADVAAGNI